ncbi:MAG TPA: hypothetical protein VF304_06120 [Casimicrobiaceae bacterium]
MDSSLRDSTAVADLALAPAACRVLDRGGKGVSAQALGEVVRELVAGKLEEVGRDRNAICHRAMLAGRRGVLQPVIVKSPRPGRQRTNPDATFAREAQVLAQLPLLGIDGAPELIARVAMGDAHFLFMAELPGSHPHPRKHPLDAARLDAIAGALQAMDRLGFMHYDLKAANVLTHADRAFFIDFEFARAGTPWDADAPAEPSFCEDFNVANNPFVRGRSNVANFEFRCLHRYLADLENVAPNAVEPLFRAWLAAKVSYHARMARCLTGRAAAHERRLARLFDDPPVAVIRVERMLMAFRTAVFERDRPGAARARRAIRAVGDSRGMRGRAVPKWYGEAATRIVDLVARSVHPTS